MTETVVATTVEEVESLRGTWESLPPSDQDAMIDTYLAVVRGSTAVMSPYVILLRLRGGRSLLVVGRLEAHPFDVRIGDRRVLTTRAPALVISFGGILGAESDEELDYCLAALDEQLHRGAAEAVVFQKVTVASALHGRIRARHHGASRIRGNPPVRRWLADLPGDMEEFMQRRSRSSRKSIRADGRKLREHYRAEVTRLDLASFGTVRSEVERVAGKSYQRALGIGATSSELGWSIAASAHARGALRVWMLYLDDRPVAFWWGYRSPDGVLALDTPGFDPDYAHDGVGIFTLLAMIDELCRTPDIRVLDFGHGDAAYKSAYANRSVEVQDEVVVASRARIRSIAFVVSGANAMNGRARAVAERLGLLDRYRRRQRARRSTPPASTEVGMPSGDADSARELP